MVHISEVAGKWVRDIREFVKQNKQYVCKVMRVDPDKNIINLSIKRVSRFDEKDKLNAYRQEQRAEKMLEQVASLAKKNVEQAYDEIGYLLQEKYGELYVAFEEISKNKDELDKIKIPDKWKKAILEIVEKNFKPKEVVLKAEIEMKSLAEDGVERIKSVLGKIESDEVKISYVSAPRYRVSFKTFDPKAGEKKLKDRLEKLVENAKQLQIESTYRFLK